jgi:hypothetical protein
MIGRIYKLTNTQTKECYIGCTTQAVNVRFSKHKNLYKRYLDGKMHYITAFALFKNGFENVIYEQLAEKNFKDKCRMYALEKKYMLDTENVVNHIPKKKKDEVKK